MQPGQILGVAHQARGPEVAVGPGLVEPDAVSGLVDRRRRGDSSPNRLGHGWRELVERLDRHQSRSGIRRGLTFEPHVARPAGIEDDEADGQPLVLVRGVLPRVVELVQDVGADAARAPLAVDRLGATVDLDRHVVGVNLGANAVEEDPPFAPDRSRRDARPPGRQARCQRFHDRATDLLADLLAALGDGDRGHEDRLGAFGTMLVGIGVGKE